MRFFRRYGDRFLCKIRKISKKSIKNFLLSNLSYKWDEWFNNWIKKYNQNHNQKISFYGFDMQNPEKSVKLVKDFVKKENIDFDIKSLDILEKDNISIKDPKMKILEENLKKLNEKLEKIPKKKDL